MISGYWWKHLFNLATILTSKGVILGKKRIPVFSKSLGVNYLGDTSTAGCKKPKKICDSQLVFARFIPFKSIIVKQLVHEDVVSQKQLMLLFFFEIKAVNFLQFLEAPFEFKRGQPKCDKRLMPSGMIATSSTAVAPPRSC